MQVGAGMAGSVSRVGKNLDGDRFTGQQTQTNRSIARAWTAGLGQCAVSDQPGVGFDGQVGLEPVLAAVHRLVGVPRFGVGHRDHPVRSDLLRDLPAWWVAALINEFDVLSGDQRRQPERVGRTGLALLAQPVQHRERVTDQRVDQLRAGRFVVPGDRRLARVVVVEPVAQSLSGGAGAR